MLFGWQLEADRGCWVWLDRGWLRRTGEASDVWVGWMAVLDRELVNIWGVSVGLGPVAPFGWKEEGWVLVEAAVDEH